MLTRGDVGYDISQRKRKCIEQCFGWAKTVGPMRQVMLRGLTKVDHAFALTMTAYNLTRLRNLSGLQAWQGKRRRRSGAQAASLRPHRRPNGTSRRGNRPGSTSKSATAPAHEIRRLRPGHGSVSRYFNGLLKNRPSQVDSENGSDVGPCIGCVCLPSGARSCHFSGEK